MSPLGRVVLGLVVVLVDIRAGGLDLVVDPVGWAVVLTGLVPLATRGRWFGRAAVAAVGGLLASCFAVLAEPAPWVVAVHTVAETGVVFCTCTALVGLLADGWDRRSAATIRWLDLALLAAALLLLAATGGRAVDVGGEMAVLVVLLAVAAIGTVVWFLVVLLRVRRHEAVQPAPAPPAPQPGATRY